MRIFLLLILMSSAFAKTHEVSLSESVTFNTGDLISLKGTSYSVEVGGPYEPVKCAIPGRNCGAGYTPPRPVFNIKCAGDPCPYILQTFNQSGTSGTLSVETEETCVQKGNQANTCFYDYARGLKSDEGCMKLKTALGKFHCLKRFEHTARPENKTLCDQLPKEIYSLRENCYYDYAILYKDPSLCEKFDKKNPSGADRCWNKMAEVMKDKTLCLKISGDKTNSYKALCDELKF